MIVLRAFLAAVSFALVATLSLDAGAFCRSRTCDPKLDDCTFEDGCNVSGAPLLWPSDCVSFVVHERGSEKHGINAKTLSRTARTAFDSWTSVDCKGEGGPSIRVEDLGTVECDASEYDATFSNANLIVIREEWPYPGAETVVGLTLVRFATKTGSIRDADIEVNGDDFDLSVGDPVEDSDLESILAHEIGHLLGLDHSLDQESTMLRDYPVSNASGRSLAEDDISGICSIYPPDRQVETTSCEPVNGLSSQCVGDPEPPPGEASEPSGCSTAGSAGGASAVWLVVFLAAASLRRRRGSRHAR